MTAACADRWRAERTWLNRHRHELARLAADRYPARSRLPGTVLVAPPEWIPAVLWRNIVREYAEELLGAPEHDDARTAPIDYDRWPLYRALAQAEHSGRLAAFLLGLGVDPLTLAVSILTAVVVDDDTFASVFGDVGGSNSEGRIVAVGAGTPADGMPFTEESVDRLLDDHPVAVAGAACLTLARRHRGLLLG